MILGMAELQLAMSGRHRSRARPAVTGEGSDSRAGGSETKRFGLRASRGGFRVALHGDGRGLHSVAG